MDATPSWRTRHRLKQKPRDNLLQFKGKTPWQASCKSRSFLEGKRGMQKRRNISLLLEIRQYGGQPPGSRQPQGQPREELERKESQTTVRELKSVLWFCQHLKEKIQREEKEVARLQESGQAQLNMEAQC